MILNANSVSSFFGRRDDNYCRNMSGQLICIPASGAKSLACIETFFHFLNGNLLVFSLDNSEAMTKRRLNFHTESTSCIIIFHVVDSFLELISSGNKNFKIPLALSCILPNNRETENFKLWHRYLQM